MDEVSEILQGFFLEIWYIAVAFLDLWRIWREKLYVAHLNSHTLTFLSDSRFQGCVQEIRHRRKRRNPHFWIGNRHENARAFTQRRRTAGESIDVREGTPADVLGVGLKMVLVLKQIKKIFENKSIQTTMRLNWTFWDILEDFLTSLEYLDCFLSHFRRFSPIIGYLKNKANTSHKSLALGTISHKIYKTLRNVQNFQKWSLQHFCT